MFIKIILSETSFIPAIGAKLDKNELHLARKRFLTLYKLIFVSWKIILTQITNYKGDVLEIGAQCSIELGDIAAFERYMTQLKNFYFDFQYEIIFI